MQMKQDRAIIVDLMSVIWTNQEATLYAKVFKQIPKESFAVIKIGGAIIRDQLIVVASAIQYCQRLEIYPIIVCGAGPQIDEELKAKNLDSKKVNGLRVTDATQLEIVVEQLMQTSKQLAEAIKKLGGQATVISDAFLVKKHELVENQDVGFVGVIEEIEQRKILLTIKDGIIPIIAPIGIDSKGQQYNINADAAAKELVKRLRSRKFILVTETGGVFNSEGAIISEITIDTDYNSLVESGQITGGMLLKVNEAKKLLEETTEPPLVHIVAPKNLLTELFTVQGAGTIVKKKTLIEILTSFDNLNIPKIKELLEESFEKKLAINYFDEKPAFVFLEKNYKGVLIIKKTTVGYYIDKFAVTPIARGEGIGKDLWNIMRENCENIFWRARLTNPQISWYYPRADGMHKFDKWVVFWEHLKLDAQEGAIKYALNKEASFVE